MLDGQIAVIAPAHCGYRTDATAVIESIDTGGIALQRERLKVPDGFKAPPGFEERSAGQDALPQSPGIGPNDAAEGKDQKDGEHRARQHRDAAFRQADRR